MKWPWTLQTYDTNETLDKVHEWLQFKLQYL